jgi:hypothetical protein
MQRGASAKSGNDFKQMVRPSFGSFVYAAPTDVTAFHHIVS